MPLYRLFSRIKHAECMAACNDLEIQNCRHYHNEILLYLKLPCKQQMYRFTFLKAIKQSVQGTSNRVATGIQMKYVGRRGKMYASRKMMQAHCYGNRG